MLRWTRLVVRPSRSYLRRRCRGSERRTGTTALVSTSLPRAGLQRTWGTECRASSGARRQVGSTTPVNQDDADRDAASSEGGTASENGNSAEEGCETSDSAEVDSEELPFPRLGWSPGSFGARALRPSRRRKPGEPVGRTKPPKTEEDYWLESGVWEDGK